MYDLQALLRAAGDLVEFPSALARGAQVLIQTTELANLQAVPLI